jgi:exoribonuclease II
VRLFDQPGTHWWMATALTETRLQQNFVVEYLTNAGTPRLGIALRPDGKKNWIVEDRNGTSLSISPKAVLFTLGDLGSPPGTPAAESLSKIEAEIEALVTANEELLEVAWEILVSRTREEGGSSVGIAGIAELVFDDVSVRSMYAVHVMLARDRFFFKGKVIKGVTIYEAKPERLVSVARSHVLAEEKRAQEESELREAILASFNRGQDGDTSALRSLLGEENFNVTVAALEAIAEDLGGRVRDAGYEGNSGAGFNSLEDPHKVAAKLVLSAVGKPTLPSSAFDVLVAWGVFVRHENLALRRAGLHKSMAFAATMISAAESLNAAEPESILDIDASYRRDLSNLVSYAVDSDDTEEIDDAVSWDAAEKLIWVHVADPWRYFPGGLSEPLVTEALRRASTLYLPTQRFTMFPEAIACDKLSLGGKSGDGSALSFGFRVSEDGSLDPDGTVVTASRIQAPLRMTYEDVDELLAAESVDSMHDICVLTRLAEKRLAFRIKDGAVAASSPFSEVHVKNGDAEEPEVTVGLTVTDTKSWLLVSELMIAACGVAGDFGEKHSLPLPYRGQEPFEYPSEEALEEIPEGPARNAAIFRSATPSEVRSEPLDHASLALDAYVQVTSPIRRSGDLLAHLQIKSALRGDAPVLDVDAMNAEISRSGDINRTLRGVDQGTSKYWHLEYLRRLGPSVPHEAVFVRPLREGESGKGLVSLTESGFQLVASVPTDTAPGSKVAVTVKQVDPRGLFSRADATLWATHEMKKKEEADFMADLFSDIDSDAGASTNTVG